MQSCWGNCRSAELGLKTRRTPKIQGARWDSGLNISSGFTWACVCGVELGAIASVGDASEIQNHSGTKKNHQSSVKTLGYLTHRFYRIPLTVLSLFNLDPSSCYN
jgi:hypothetical protein